MGRPVVAQPEALAGIKAALRAWVLKDHGWAERLGAFDRLLRWGGRKEKCDHSLCMRSVQ